MTETVTHVRVPCIREPGCSRYGPGWHSHTFGSRAEYEAWLVLDRLRDPDEEPHCPPSDMQEDHP